MFFYSKRIFFISIIFIVFLFFSGYYVYKSNISLVRDGDLPSRFVVTKMHDLTYQKFNKDGDKIYIATSNYVEEFFSGNIEAKYVSMDSFDENGKKTWNLKGDKGISNNPKSNSDILILDGNVVGTLPSDDEKSTPVTHFYTDRVYFNTKDNHFYNNIPVKIARENKDNEVTGIGLDGYINQDTVAIKKQVRSIYA